MRFSHVFIPASLALILSGDQAMVHAQNEIHYDPEKGILFVDKKDSAKSAGTSRSTSSSGKSVDQGETVLGGPPPQIPVLSSHDSTDLHVGRKKDPPTLYFMSGLEYFKNGDYANALHNFLYADSVGKKPLFRLWVGKTWRHLDKPQKMLAIMKNILKNQAECDVADDALFEMAAYFQDIDDYDTASLVYIKLSEQYPFGESHSTGERYIDVAQEQRKMMRAEMNNMLAILGYTNEELSDNYRNFQKNHRLPETGVGDRATVQAIKKKYQKMLDREQQNARIKEQAKQYLLWASVAGAAGFLNILLSFGLLRGLVERKKHIAELKENIAELDMRTL